MTNPIVGMQTLQGVAARLAGMASLVALFTAAPCHTAWAQTAPPLLTAGSYGVVAGSTVTNTGTTTVYGDLGLHPGTAVSDVGTLSVTGATNTATTAPAVALQAKSDALAVYTNLSGQLCTADMTGVDLGGKTLGPGVYCFTSSAFLTGTVPLTLKGGPDSVWIFKTVSTLITGPGASVVMDGGQECHVFWRVGSSATLDTTTKFIGTIVADQSIGLKTGASLAGRALALNAAVTMDSNTIRPSACAANVTPTLRKAFSPATINAGTVSTLTITLSNANNTAANLTAPLVDTLPAGVVINGISTTTCGGTLTALNGASTVTLAASGSSIPLNGSCTLTVPVTAPAGSYLNTLPVGALQTDKGSNAVAALAPLTVVTANGAPGLSLSKTANRATYTTVDEVIVYTYVLRNTGNVALKGPFTVVDDKLGSFACGSAVTLAPAASVTCTKKYTTQIGDLGNVTSFPSGVVAKVKTGTWLQGYISAQNTTITGAGPGVPDGLYPGWCIQDHVFADLNNQTATLYSTIGGGLPGDVAGLPWKKVNYILNNQVHGAGKTDLAFIIDVQTAIWVVLGETHPTYGVSATAQQMVDAANAHPGFVPGPDDFVAAIVYSDGMGTATNSIQETIIAIRPLKSIVNHATGSATFEGGVVRSGEAQATVKQTR